MQGGAGAGAGGAGGKPAFGDLSQPVTELEKFRAKLDDVKLALQQQGASAQDVLLREAELWRQEASAAGLTAQEVIQARQQLDTTWSQLLKQKAAEAKAEADQETRAAKQAADEQTRDMTTNYRQQMELVKSDNDEALAAIKAAHSTSRADELQAEAAYWRQIIALTRAGTQQQIEAIKQLGTVTQQIANEQAATSKQAAKETERAWDQAFAPIGRAFDTVITGMMTRQQTFRTSITRASQQIVTSFVSDVTQMATKWVTHEVMKTAATLAGNATRTAADNTGFVTFLGKIPELLAQWLGFETAKTAGTTASDAVMTASDAATAASAQAAAKIAGLAYAGEAAAAAMSSVAAIPLIGWAMAPGVGAETFATAAAFASYDTGTMGVPQTMMALVHQGEIIVPAGPSSLIRSGGATLGGPSAGGGMTLAPSFNLNLAALDARSVQQLFSNPTFTRMLTNLVNRGAMLNPSLS